MLRVLKIVGTSEEGEKQTEEYNNDAWSLTKE